MAVVRCRDDCRSVESRTIQSGFAKRKPYHSVGQVIADLSMISHPPHLILFLFLFLSRKAVPFFCLYNDIKKKKRKAKEKGKTRLYCQYSCDCRLLDFHII